MSKLLVKPDKPNHEGCVINITPDSAGWDYVGFSVHELKPGQHFSYQQPARESCLVILSGAVSVEAGDDFFEEILSRESVFASASPAALYCPASTAVKVIADKQALVAVCSAPGSVDSPLPVRLIKPESIELEIRGSGTNERHVRAILPESAKADSLLVFEVITPGGHWSSYPPHKHDTDALPDESALEETYYHLLNPKQGFAFQRVYTDDRSLDETMAVEHGDCVLVPEGYHPVGAPHGYDSYYLNVMAGAKRTWVFHNDPDHEWVLNAGKQ